MLNKITDFCNSAGQKTIIIAEGDFNFDGSKNSIIVLKNIRIKGFSVEYEMLLSSQHTFFFL